MIQTNSQPLQDILLAFLRQEGLETPLLEYRITQAWPEVMGEMVNRYTKQVFVRDGKLHVQLTSAPLRQNLMMEHKRPETQRPRRFLCRQRCLFLLNGPASLSSFFVLS